MFIWIFCLLRQGIFNSRSIGATTFFFVISLHTVISRKVVEKNVHATIPKGNMGYVQYTVPDTVAVEPTFVSFL